jgi:formate dehydrogenase iron-sulfur subunit
MRFDMEIRVGAGAYVCGEETALLNSLEGKRGVVRAKPPLPALEGFLGRPTVVNNVISLATVPVIFEKGAITRFRQGRSRGTMPFQIAGNVKFGGLFETAFGMSLGELVEDVCGGTASGRPVKAVQVGGPLGAYFGVAKFDTPFGYEEFDGAGRSDRPCRDRGVSTTPPTCSSRRASRWSSAPSRAAGNARPAGSARCGVSRQDRIGIGDGRRRSLMVDLCDTMKDSARSARWGASRPIR